MTIHTHTLVCVCIYTHTCVCIYHVSVSDSFCAPPRTCWILGSSRAQKWTRCQGYSEKKSYSLALISLAFLRHSLPCSAEQRAIEKRGKKMGFFCSSKPKSICKAALSPEMSPDGSALVCVMTSLDHRDEREELGECVVPCVALVLYHGASGAYTCNSGKLNCLKASQTKL